MMRAMSFGEILEAQHRDAARPHPRPVEPGETAGWKPSRSSHGGSPGSSTLPCAQTSPPSSNRNLRAIQQLPLVRRASRSASQRVYLVEASHIAALDERCQEQHGNDHEEDGGC
jgi:hypothetical protein